MKGIPVQDSHSHLMLPGWVNFFEHYFPDLKDVPSTAKSPQQMFGAIAKSYFAEKIGINRKDMVVVSIMPCLTKKYECQRDEFSVDGNPMLIIQSLQGNWQTSLNRLTLT